MASELSLPLEEDVKNYYYNFWTQKGSLPSVVEVARAFNANPVVIRNMVEDAKFRDILVRRGLPLSLTGVLSPEQFKCIAILTDPTVKGNQAARLKQAGVAYNTYKAWMQQPEFRRNMTQMAEQILENNLAGVNMGLVNAAERGEVAAVKFFYEVTGRYDPTDKKVMDVMGVLSGVVEILSAEITDTEVLGRIAAKLQMLAVNSGIGMAGGGTIKQAPYVVPENNGLGTFTLTPLGELP